MTLELPVIARVAAALVVALLISFISTPVVKSIAQRVGAMDIPKDNRRMHHHPIPRMGGLAIFLGFLLSALIFVPMDQANRGMLLGAVVIVILGIFDDIYALPALPKLLVQIGAALIAVLHGNVIEVLSNPNLFSENPYWNLGSLAIPLSVIWIVAITNAVNLIDGLDGLAVGVATISSLTMLVIAMLVSEGMVALMMAALAGGCIGFMPYNMNPAKIFMGDTGSTFLGFILAVVSIQGLFKFYTIISFAVPFLMLGLPLFDTCFAILRRLSKGQSPMAPDRSHVHHRLIDMGLNQKQAVAVLYVISAILGLSAVVLATSGEIKAILCLMALIIVCLIAVRVIFLPHMSDEEKKHFKEHSLRQELSMTEKLLQEIFSRHLGDSSISEEAMKAFEGRMEEFIRLSQVLECSEQSVTEQAAEISALQEKETDCDDVISRQQKAQWELEKKLDHLAHCKDQTESLKQVLAENDRIREEITAIDLALETMTELSATIRDSFGLYLNKTASDLISGITGGIYDSMSVDENLNVFMNTRTRLVPVEQVSSGTMDQIYLALRLAAAKLIQPEGDYMPLIFDDSFVLYDEDRLHTALKWLKKAYPGQIIIFTCHQREAQMMTADQIAYHLVTM